MIYRDEALPRVSLGRVRPASRCQAHWDDMVGDERTRFCGQCGRNVFHPWVNPFVGVGAGLGTESGKPPLRLYRRSDGTLLTADCPVAVRRRRHRIAACTALLTCTLAAVFKWSSPPPLARTGQPCALRSPDHSVLLSQPTTTQLRAMMPNVLKSTFTYVVFGSPLRWGDHSGPLKCERGCVVQWVDRANCPCPPSDLHCVCLSKTGLWFRAPD
jgi:hypothetical protein